MITYAEARSLVQEKLAALPPATPSDSWTIADSEERPWGWVFYYDSRLHRETGESRYAVAGNAPFIVRRADGAILTTRTARPVEEYISELQRAGRL